MLKRRRHIDRSCRRLLKKWPQTEQEYWAAIEAFGGVAFRISHAFSHGRIEDMTQEEVDQRIDQYRRLQQILLNEIRERFNIVYDNSNPRRSIDDSDPLPDGSKYYWDWYNEQKREFYQKEYNGLLCSACPFSTGLDDYIRKNQIPCSQFGGSLYFLSPPYKCGKVGTESYEWSQEELYNLIRNQFGEEVLQCFIDKEEEIRAACAKPAQVRAKR